MELIIWRKKMELINLELKFSTKKLNPQINLPFNSEIFLQWQSYSEYRLLGLGIPSRHLE